MSLIILSQLLFHIDPAACLTWFLWKDFIPRQLKYFYWHNFLVVIALLLSFSKVCVWGIFLFFLCVFCLLGRLNSSERFVFVSIEIRERIFVLFWQITRHSFVYGIEEYRHCVSVCLFYFAQSSPETNKNKKKNKKIKRKFSVKE